MNRIKKIGVICAYQFPEGMAPTIRILAYCKGLQQNGVRTEVFTFKETPADTTEPLEGEVQGIPYHKSYLKRNDGSFSKIVDKLFMLKRLVKQINESYKKEQFDYLLLSFDTLDKFYIFVPLLKIQRYKLLFIGDEFPEPIRRLKERIPIWQKYAYRFIYRFIDGRVLMTENLKVFYDKEVCPKPTYILNSIIDEERFCNIIRQPVKQKYFCYMGNMQLAKDNVDNIIRAFAKISSFYPEYELWLFGTPTDKDRAIVESVIEDCKMQSKVFIKGRVDYNEVPQILANATILVTSQPITKRAEGGFPTKMAEYMMSGTPMIVTNVGEIHKYVQDGENTFMVEPCDSQAYADKIEYILQHPDAVALVTDRALVYAKKYFSARTTTSGLILFMANLN